MSMENDMYNAPLEDITHHHHLIQKPLIHCYSFDLNNQNHIINGIPVLSSEQDQVDGGFLTPNSFVTSQQGKTIHQDASNPIINSDFQVSSLPARFGLQENLQNFPSMEALGSYIFNNWHDSSTFGDSNVYEVPSNGTSFMPYLESNGWQTSSSNVGNLANLGYSSSNCSNELSLSLATSPNTGQCSEISSSSNCSNMELSMCLGSHKHVKFSPAILGSRYLSEIQEILVQIAKYSFENLEEVNHSSVGGNKSSSAFGSMRRLEINHDASSMTEVNVDSPLQRHASESKKSQLLMLLQMVDNQYSHCLDEIHTVVSAFHAATELDPHIHAHFALQTVSLLYKDLRERISNYILSMGSNFNSSSWSSEERECSVETSFIQKQWALHQLKRKDQLWRPQRGLPERSVSVLRDWMFQNFLHPYPKDAEKHLLAVKSGLTRSQVSNWFINARVRLWKPLIDEMYAEMNRRKESSHRSMNNRMFNIN